ncbi:MAG: hypothetical protein JO332_05930 [Planctomycetaceae bacterium]|nr:hypothetical protein [Planctomycetaceae bacterium]
MHLLFCLAAAQALLSAPPGEGDLPRSFDPERVEPFERQPIYPWIGIEPMAVWTAFDNDLGVKDVWGYGADATVTLDYGTRAFLGFRAGYIGWNTRVESSPGVEHSCWIRQYRIGVFGQFPFRFLEFGVGANVGGYRFRRDGDGDTAGFFEFQAMLGWRPSPYGWLGLIAMQTFSSSDFNHSNEHFILNYSIGPAFELRF